jgi:hypothetical protein
MLVVEDDYATTVLRRADKPEPEVTPDPTQRTIASWVPRVVEHDTAEEPRRLWPWAVAGAVIFFVIVGGFVLAAAIRDRRDLSSVKNTQPTVTATPTAMPTPTATPTPTPTPKPSPTPTPTPEVPEVNLVGSYVIYEYSDKTETPRGTIEITSQNEEFGIALRDPGDGWVGNAKLEWKGKNWEGMVHYKYLDDSDTGDSSLSIFPTGMIVGRMPNQDWVFIGVKQTARPSN